MLQKQAMKRQERAEQEAREHAERMQNAQIRYNFQMQMASQSADYWNRVQNEWNAGSEERERQARLNHRRN